MTIIHVFLLIVGLSVVQPIPFSEMAAIVDEPVTLPCNCSGKDVEWKLFIPKEATICPNQTHCQTGFSLSRGNFSLRISSAVYNDEGSYRCTCDGKLSSEVKLKVYVPRIVKAIVGKNVTLPCYGDTRRDTKDVVWKKDGKKLLEYHYLTTSESSGGRFTVSEEGFQHGDLSLNISKVQLSDAGFYLCLIQGESRDGDPRGVLLKLEICPSVVQPFSNIDATMNEPVTLPCNCSGKAVEWTRFIPSNADIGKCSNRTCQIETHYQTRFSVSGDTSRGNFSLNISSAVYNDEGSYRCTCDGKPVSEVKLQVYVPVKAIEGENITLPCYRHIQPDTKNAVWNKDGKKLLEYHYLITNESSGGRFTVSEEAFKHGDLSLNISEVQLSDAGFYLCLIQGESCDGDPRGVLLNVEKRQPTAQLPTTPTKKALVIVGVILLVIVGICIYLFTKYLSRRSQDPPSTNVRTPVQEEYQLMPKPSSTQPIHDSLSD